MYKLIVKRGDVTIIEKTLSRRDCESISSYGAQWVIDVFKKFIGLNIGNYTLSEYINGIDSFTLFIREEDIQKLRNKKLDSLF